MNDEIKHAVDTILSVLRPLDQKHQTAVLDIVNVNLNADARDNDGVYGIKAELPNGPKE